MCNGSDWKQHPVYQGYWLSKDGRVGSTGKSKVNFKLLKPFYDKDGYIQRVISFNGKAKTYRLHAIILETFVGPCPSGMECRHIDGNRSNNRLENLCWSTHIENILDKKVHGTWQTGERHGMHKLTRTQVNEIRNLSKTKSINPYRISKMFGVSRTTIVRIINNKTWKVNY